MYSSYAVCHPLKQEAEDDEDSTGQIILISLMLLTHKVITQTVTRAQTEEIITTRRTATKQKKIETLETDSLTSEDGKQSEGQRVKLSSRTAEGGNESILDNDKIGKTNSSQLRWK